jgi:hypothetical protein
MASNSEVELNDPSLLRIKKPNVECTAKRIAKIQEKLNEKAPGWEVFRNEETGECLYYDTRNQNVKSYFPTPRAKMNKSCAYLGGSKKKRKSKTHKRRK